MLDTFDHTEFPATDLSAQLPGSVSVVIPTRNTAGTIAATVAELLLLAEIGIVDQVLVVDADSPDGTAVTARGAGAEVVSENELAPGFGPVLGKGDAMWRSLTAVRGDLVVFIDGDIADFGRHYVTGLLGPLCEPGPGDRDATRPGSTSDPRVDKAGTAEESAAPAWGFVKGTYRRPFRHDDTELPAGGGRVTELTARPLLARLAPDLMQFDQPLAGEVAARRDLLEDLPFVTGYGVEIAMLVEVWNRLGIEGMAQVGLGTKRNTHQPLAALGGMAAEVIAALADTLDSLGRPDLGSLHPAAATGPEMVVRPSWNRIRAEASPDPAAR